MPRKPWEKQESRLAHLTEGTRNSGSGSGWVRKHDVRSGWRHLIEAKWTRRRSFILKLGDLKVLEHRATLEDRTPAFCVEFWEDKGGGHGVAHRYVVLREEDYFDGDPRLDLPPSA